MVQVKRTLPILYTSLTCLRQRDDSRHGGSSGRGWRNSPGPPVGKKGMGVGKSLAQTLPSPPGECFLLLPQTHLTSLTGEGEWVLLLRRGQVELG